MGKVNFSGPVYGAKSLLWTVGPILGVQNTSTAVVAVNTFRALPVYEDWYITEVQVGCSTCSSSDNKFMLKSEGGSTTGILRADGVSTKAQTVATFNTVTSTTLNSMVAITATAGEYEGLWVPAGSTLRFVSSGASAPSNVLMQVMGYIRYVDSTRAS